MTLKQQHFHAALGEVIGDGAADDAAADDNDLGAVRQIGHFNSVS